MQTREEAIAYLREHGFHAVARDWAMGETIGIFAEKLNEMLYAGIIYIYPSEKGWSIATELNNLDLNYASLSEAVLAAEQIAPRYRAWMREIYQSLETQEPQVTPDRAPKPAPNENQLKSEGLINWKAPHLKAGMHLFRSTEEMRRIWLSHGGGDTGMPDIDFAKYMVAAIFVDAGEYHTAPCILSIEKVDNRIKVFYGTMHRPWPMIDPHCVVKVAYADGEVEFIDTGESDQLR
jgi:hypothetical protein